MPLADTYLEAILLAQAQVKVCEGYITTSETSEKSPYFHTLFLDRQNNGQKEHIQRSSNDILASFIRGFSLHVFCSFISSSSGYHGIAGRHGAIFTLAFAEEATLQRFLLLHCGYVSRGR